MSRGGAEEDPEKLSLTDRLFEAQRAEAQVVCVGQPMLVVGDLNADPEVIPCLAKGIASGRLVDLLLLILWALVRSRMLLAG